MSKNKLSIEKEISEIESDLCELQRSISKYDESKQNAQTSPHVESLISSLKEIEKEIEKLPDIMRNVSNKDN